jgi:hypothetical protein
MHNEFGEGGWLEDATQSGENDWHFETDPGQTGPDATWHGEGNSPLPGGANIAELKPYNNAAIAEARAQVAAWGQGRCALYVYDMAGNIYFWGII